MKKLYEGKEKKKKNYSSKQIHCKGDERNLVYYISSDNTRG